jgi:DNA-binding transcriptional regulator YiaG
MSLLLLYRLSLKKAAPTTEGKRIHALRRTLKIPQPNFSAKRK